MPIEYTSSLDGVEPEHLQGFFEGWPSPPSPERHLDLLRGSYRIVLARELGSPRSVGFANAISDGVLYAFIPLLEVLPSHRGRGIGSELVQRLLERAEGLLRRRPHVRPGASAVLRAIRHAASRRHGDPPPMTGLGGQITRLAQHSAIYGLGGLVSRFVALLLLPLYTRYLTPADYGAVETLVALAAILATDPPPRHRERVLPLLLRLHRLRPPPARRPHLLLVHDDDGD